MTEALAGSCWKEPLLGGGEREGAQPSSREEGHGGHRGVSRAEAPGRGPPGGAGHGLGRARWAARASCRLRPGVGREPPGAGREPGSGSPDRLTWRWIELHHLPCLDLFCSRAVPLPLLRGLVVTSFRIISRKPRPKETEEIYLYFYFFFSFFLAHDKIFFLPAFSPMR